MNTINEIHDECEKVTISTKKSPNVLFADENSAYLLMYLFN